MEGTFDLYSNHFHNNHKVGCKLPKQCHTLANKSLLLLGGICSRSTELLSMEGPDAAQLLEPAAQITQQRYRMVTEALTPFTLPSCIRCIRGK